jgi:hypothetical protein
MERAVVALHMRQRHIEIDCGGIAMMRVRIGQLSPWLMLLVYKLCVVWLFW